MSLVHILDRQTDEIIGTLSIKNAEYWGDTRKDSLENQNTFDFIANASLEKATLLEKRNKLLIQDEDGIFREYVIVYAEQYKRNEKTIRSNASFTDLAKAKVIDPQELQGATSSTAIDLALFGTEWSPGIIEYNGIRTITIEDYTNPLALLKLIASTFELEISYRVEINGSHIVGRYVDMRKQFGGFEGKEITFAKDLIGVKRKEDSSGIVTALLGIGPEKEDGTRLTILVENREAFQRWGRGGQHLIEPYAPQSSNQDMTVEELQTLTENELKKRIDAIVSYECEAVSIEHVKGFSHEKIRKGQTVRIKDDFYQPPLYVEGRIQEVDREHSTKKIKSFKIGNFIEYKKADLEAQISVLKKLMSQKLTIATQKAFAYTEEYSEKKKILSATPPNDTAVIWVKPDPEKNVNIAHAHDGTEWVPLTTTNAADIVEGEMLFDRLRGGSLRLGQAYQNGVLEVWVDSNNDGELELVGRVDSGGAYYPLLQGDKIRGDVVNTLQLGNIHYYVDLVNGNDLNDGLSWDAPKKNFQVFVDGLPKNLNGKWIQINVRGDVLNGMKIEGFHNGDLIIVANTIEGTRRPRIFGPTILSRLFAGKFQIQGYDANGDSSTVNQTMFKVNNCDYVQFYDVKVYGNSKAKHAFQFDACKFSVEECHVYDISDRAIHAANLSHGRANNNHGSAPVAILVESGSILTGEGTRMSGSVLRLGNSYLGGNNTDVWAVESGTTPPVTPPEASEQTMIVSASTGDNWGDMYGWNNDEVRQGNYGYGTRHGIWYFDLSALRGKTIVSATITLYRGSGGASGARTVHLRTHPYKNRTERPAGQPALSAVGATTTIEVGQTKTVDITSMIQTNIANFTDNSIGVHTTGSTDYMVLGTTPTLVIRYK
jgi:phage minor structural protein